MKFGEGGGLIFRRAYFRIFMVCLDQLQNNRKKYFACTTQCLKVL